jgi:hypothetical protein
MSDRIQHQAMPVPTPTILEITLYSQYILRLVVEMTLYPQYILPLVVEMISYPQYILCLVVKINDSYPLYIFTVCSQVNAFAPTVHLPYSRGKNLPIG